VHEDKIKQLEIENQQLKAELNLLRKKEKLNQFKVLFSESSSAILLIDPKTLTIKEANNSACQFYGYSPEEFSQIYFSQISHTPKNNLAENIHNTLKNKQNIFYSSHKTKNNEIVEVEIFANSLTINNYSYILLIIIDITKLKTYEIENTKARFSLNKAEELAQIGHWEFDLNTNIVKASMGARIIYGLGIHNEMLTILDAQTIPLKEYRAILDKAMSDLITKGSNYDLEFKIKRKNDNEIRNIHSIAEYDKLSNTVFGIIKDITEEKKIKDSLVKQNENYAALNEEYSSLIDDLTFAKNKITKSEEYFKALFNESPVLFWEEDFSAIHNEFQQLKKSGITDLENYLNQNPNLVSDLASKVKVLDINNACINSFGASSKKEFFNHFSSFFTPKAIADFKNEMIQLFKGEKQFECISEHKKLNGEIIHIYLKLFVPSGFKNTLKRVIVSMIDITEIVNYKNKLNNALLQVHKSEQLKVEFIRNISHEIRTPLNGIMGFSSLLLNPKLTIKKKQKFVEIIQDSGNQLLNIVEALLEISRLESHSEELITEKVCLNKKIDNLNSIYKSRAKDKNLKLIVTKPLSDEESTILTDKSKLFRILSNLIENAINYTNKGFIELGYNPVVQTDNKLSQNNIEIYVKDSGIGIDKKNFITIFKPFSQEDKSLEKHTGGLGLGLSISKGMAKLLGGEIKLYSKKGLGSNFILQIPYKNEANKQKEQNAQITTKHKIAKIILIVEDELLNFELLKQLLTDTSSTLNILYAENGQKAIELCKNNPEIDLVLMDLKMPVLNGYEATKKIKEFRKTLPIIAQTAYAEPEEKEKAMQAGCDEFTSKPINISELLKKMRKFLTF